MSLKKRGYIHVKQPKNPWGKKKDTTFFARKLAEMSERFMIMVYFVSCVGGFFDNLREVLKSTSVLFDVFFSMVEVVL